MKAAKRNQSRQRRPVEASTQGRSLRSSPSSGKARHMAKGDRPKKENPQKEKSAVDAAAHSDRREDDQSEWLLNIQRKLYQWSSEHPNESYRDLWNWIINPKNLRIAYGKVRLNVGRNTPGVDGMTIKGIEGDRKEVGVTLFLESIGRRLKEGQYTPSPVRRKWIPKPGKTDQKRGLGIPTIEDRVVQCAIKQIIEPIFEARFLHVSHGFRPGRAVRDAVEGIRAMMRVHKREHQRKEREPYYPWVIEGDIKSCFDQIGHHPLMQKVRQGVTDRRVTQLITAFLKAGIMENAQSFLVTSEGTPQGGILSPLLANIALSAIEERYRRWVYPQFRKNGTQYEDHVARAMAAKHRVRDIKKGQPIFYPIRYADDFVILCSGDEASANQEKEALAEFLKQELGLTLSPEKTKITRIEAGFNFLGHQFQKTPHPTWGWHFVVRIPPDRVQRIRGRIREVTSSMTRNQNPEWVLKKVNSLTMGWAHFYKHVTSAWIFFKTHDTFVFKRIDRWLRRHKYPKESAIRIYRRFYHRDPERNRIRWTDGETISQHALDVPRGRWDPSKRKIPLYMHEAGKPGA